MRTDKPVTMVRITITEFEYQAKNWPNLQTVIDKLEQIDQPSHPYWLLIYQNGTFEPRIHAEYKPNLKLPNNHFTF